MKIPRQKLFFGLAVILVILASFCVIGFSVLKKSGPTMEITNAEAILRVKNLPEVKQYISDLTKAKSRAEFNAEDSGEDWSVQVFEIVEQGEDSHTATFNWYQVDKKTGTITNEFDSKNK